MTPAVIVDDTEPHDSTSWKPASLGLRLTMMSARLGRFLSPVEICGIKRSRKVQGSHRRFKKDGNFRRYLVPV
jgi:hypothetical protein